MGRGRKSATGALVPECPKTPGQLAYPLEEVTFSKLFSPAVAGEKAPMEETGGQHRIQSDMLAFSSVHDLRAQLCSLIGATESQVNNGARYALGLDSTAPAPRNDAQPVLARALAALVCEGSKPPPKAAERGLRFAVSSGGPGPERPVLAFDLFQEAPAQDVLPSGSGPAPAPPGSDKPLPEPSTMTKKAMGAELVPYGLPFPKVSKVALAQIVQQARKEQERAAEAGDSDALGASPLEIPETPSPIQPKKKPPPGKGKARAKPPRVDDMSVEAMRAELSIHGVTISGDRAMISDFLKPARAQTASSGSAPPEVGAMSITGLWPELATRGFDELPQGTEIGKLRALVAALRAMPAAPLEAMGEPLGSGAPGSGSRPGLLSRPAKRPAEPEAANEAAAPPGSRSAKIRRTSGTETITEVEMDALGQQGWGALVERFEDAAARYRLARRRAAEAVSQSDFAKANRLIGQRGEVPAELSTVRRELCGAAGSAARQRKATPLMRAAAGPDLGARLQEAQGLNTSAAQQASEWAGSLGSEAPASLRAKVARREWAKQGLVSVGGLVSSSVGTTILNPVISSAKLHKKVTVEGRLDISLREILKDDGHDYHDLLELDGQKLAVKTRQSGLGVLPESAWAEAWPHFAGSLLTQWPQIGPSLGAHRGRVIKLLRQCRSKPVGLAACRCDFAVRESATRTLRASAGLDGKGGLMHDWALIPELMQQATLSLALPRCKICGSPDHETSQCPESLVDGDSPRAQPRGRREKDRREGRGEKICFRLNGKKGCAKKDCPLTHKCQRCRLTSLSQLECRKTGKCKPAPAPKAE